MSRPILFLAFANDLCDEKRYLRSLREEKFRLEELTYVSPPQPWEVICRSNVTPDVILRTFQDPRHAGRIAVFHFGGHADASCLQVESDAGESAGLFKDGLAAFLGQQAGLRLVFLNGCCTRELGQAIRSAGVPSVIATDIAISDAVATEFSSRVYASLVAGRTVMEAFNVASAACRAQIGDDVNRSLRWDEMTQQPVFAEEAKQLMDEKAWPWKLLTRDAKAGDWSLAEAVADPLFGVPLPAPAAPPPGSPFRVLARFTAADWPIYFGRGRQIKELYQKCVASAPGIILYHGASGAGKSSLLEAGLGPRVEGTHRFACLRRTRANGLVGDLRAHLAALAKGSTPLSVAECWRHLEQQPDSKPLLIVLDQAEETFTRPQDGGDAEAEWQSLLAELAPLFGPSAQLPRGKLILSFRKEWLPEIEKRVRTLTVGYDKLFLPPLDRPGVIEGVEGVTRTQELRDSYHITLADGLAEDIATELLQDRESPVAPTLEVLLQDLWDASANPPKEGHHFSRELYDSLVKRGLTLRAFLARQLAELGKYPELKAHALETGLALDLLAYHTTSLGTAERRSRGDIAQHYAHLKPQLLDDLLIRLEELNLIFNVGSSSAGAASTDRITRLAHDSLAPLVTEAFDNSDLPGQRARRILETRVEGVDNPAELMPLDDYDLGVVEAGIQGMRAQKEQEPELLLISLHARRNRSRSKKVQRAVIATLVVAVFIALAHSILANKNLREKNALVTSTLDQLKSTTEHLAEANRGLGETTQKLTLSERAAQNASIEAAKRAEEAIHLRSMDQYSTGLRELAAGHHGEGIAYLSQALDIWPQNRLAADRLFGVLTQKWLAIPLRGPFKAYGSADPDLAVLPDGRMRFIGTFVGLPQEHTQDGDPLASVADGIKFITELPAKPEDDELTTLKELKTTDGTPPHAFSNRAVWSVDGTQIVDVISHDEDDEIVVYNLADSGKPVATLRRREDRVTGVLFFPRNNGVVAVLSREGDDRTKLSRILLWRYDPKQPRAKEIAVNVEELNTPAEALLASRKYDLQFNEVRQLDGADRIMMALHDIVEGSETEEGEALWHVRGAEVDWDKLSILVSDDGLTFKSNEDGPTEAIGHGIPVDTRFSARSARGSFSVTDDGDLIIGDAEDGPAPFHFRSGKKEGTPPKLVPRDEEPWKELGFNGQFWPGTDKIAHWNSRGCMLIDARQRALDVAWSLDASLNACLRAGPCWAETDHALASPTGYLITSTFSPRPGDTTGSPELDEFLCVLNDVRPSFLHPVIIGSAAATDRGESPEEEEVDALVAGPSPQGDKIAIEFGATRNDASRLLLVKKDGSTIELLGGLRQAPHRIFAAGCFSPDNRLLAVVADGRIIVCEADTGTPITNPAKLQVSLIEPHVVSFEQPSAIAFTEHSEVVCVMDRTGCVLLWDWRRASPFSEILMPFRQGTLPEMRKPALKIDNGWLEIGMHTKDQHFTCRYEIGLDWTAAGAGISPDVRRLAECVGGLKSDDNGVVTAPGPGAPSPAAEIRRLRTIFDSPNADLTDPSVRLGRWFLADRATRTVSPNAKQTIPETFEQLLKMGAFSDAELLTFSNPEKIAKLKTAREQAEK